MLAGRNVSHSCDKFTFTLIVLCRNIMGHACKAGRAEIALATSCRNVSRTAEYRNVFMTPLLMAKKTMLIAYGAIMCPLNQYAAEIADLDA
jgi:hypothetical protein